MSRVGNWITIKIIWNEVHHRNLFEVINAFAKFDAILRDHIKNGSRNAKMLSWNIQKDIISCWAECPRLQKAIIADDVWRESIQIRKYYWSLSYTWDISMESRNEILETKFQTEYISIIIYDYKKNKISYLLPSFLWNLLLARSSWSFFKAIPHL